MNFYLALIIGFILGFVVAAFIFRKKPSPPSDGVAVKVVITAGTPTEKL